MEGLLDDEIESAELLVKKTKQVGLALNDARKPGELLEGTFKKIQGTTVSIVNGLAKIGFALYGLNQITGVLKQSFGGLFNAGTDIFRAEPGGVGDAFFDALVGADQGTNTLSNWFNTVKPGFRYDSATNKFYDIRTGNVATSEEALNQPPTTQPPGGGTGGSGTGGPTAPDLAYNAIGQLGPRGESNINPTTYNATTRWCSRWWSRWCR